MSARYREITTSKGHDAFLVEWEQLGRILGEALGEALAGTEATTRRVDLPGG